MRCRGGRSGGQCVRNSLPARSCRVPFQRPMVKKLGKASGRIVDGPVVAIVPTVVDGENEYVDDCCIEGKGKNSAGAENSDSVSHQSEESTRTLKGLRFLSPYLLIMRWIRVVGSGSVVGGHSGE